MNLATIAEATRLTRAGRLAEATALLCGGAAPDAGTPPMRTARPSRPALAGAAAAAPEQAGTFVTARHTGAAGTMTYKLYLPRGLKPGAPLVVMLHGCTQSPDDFARGTRMNALADEMGFIVAYPEQTARANAQRCWNWFAPGHQRRDAGEPALIAGLTREVIAAHAADPARVYVAGLSAGGAAAAVMAEAYPDLYAAAGIHSGLACGSARDVASALQAMKRGAGKRAARTGGLVPTIIFHGDRDATVSDRNGDDIAADVVAAAGAALDRHSEQGRSAGGRDYTRTISTFADGRVALEQWTIHGGGHAWSGGDAAGSYTDPAGPDASRAMLRFFLAVHPA